MTVTTSAVHFEVHYNSFFRSIRLNVSPLVIRHANVVLVDGIDDSTHAPVVTPLGQIDVKVPRGRALVDELLRTSAPARAFVADTLRAGAYLRLKLTARVD